MSIKNPVKQLNQVIFTIKMGMQRDEVVGSFVVGGLFITEKQLKELISTNALALRHLTDACSLVLLVTVKRYLQRRLQTSVRAISSL